MLRISLNMTLSLAGKQSEDTYSGLASAVEVWGELPVTGSPCSVLKVHDSPETAFAKMEHEKLLFHLLNFSTPSAAIIVTYVWWHRRWIAVLCKWKHMTRKEGHYAELYSGLHVKSKIKLQFNQQFHSNCSIFKKEWHNYLGRVMERINKSNV